MILGEIFPKYIASETEHKITDGEAEMIEIYNFCKDWLLQRLDMYQDSRNMPISYHFFFLYS